MSDNPEMLHEDVVNDLLESRKFGKYTYSSIKNEKDHIAIMNRIQRNGVKLDLVTEILENVYGGRFKVDELLKFARQLAKKINTRVDRLANRNRSALLCWFAENWDDVYPFLHDFITDKYLFSDEALPVEKSPTDENVDPSDISQLLNHH